MNNWGIETESLSKIYNGVTALDGLNIKVPKGSIYGFLGPNGSGKTTTIKILLGLVKATNGTARVLNYDANQNTLAIREKTGYVPESPGMFDYLKVTELLEFCAGCYKTWDQSQVNKYVELFELPGSKKIKELSKGMKNQLALTAALGSRPELLLLDEPTSGLDPIKSRDFLAVLVEQVAETGQTVFFSSHRLNEVERIADHVGLISHGRTLLEGELESVKANYKKVKVVLTPEQLEEIKKFNGVSKVENQGHGYLLTVREGLPQFIEKTDSLGVEGVEIINLSLEDIFMDLVERGAVK